LHPPQFGYFWKIKLADSESEVRWHG
jgi:hypothetical protein